MKRNEVENEKDEKLRCGPDPIVILLRDRPQVFSPFSRSSIPNSFMANGRIEGLSFRFRERLSGTNR